MLKSVRIFLFLLLTCSLLVCFYYAEIEWNVRGRFNLGRPHLLGSNLRHLRSESLNEELTAGASAEGKKTTRVLSTPTDGNNNITGVVHRLGNAGPSSSSSNSSSEAIHLAVIFCNAGQQATLKRNFRKMLRSLLANTTPDLTSLHFHLITDSDSWEAARDAIHKESSDANLAVQVSAYLIGKFVEQFSDTIETMQQYFSAKPGTYYSQALFYVSVRLPDIVPTSVNRLIFVDADTEFREGPDKLAAQFDDFDEEQLLGLAPELTPVYRHILYIYRHKHKSTLLGEPKGRGFPGYNSGVVLMRLDRIRRSTLYNSLLTNASLAQLTTKYSFKGHLGDQDFYTLAALEYPQLFHTLPCNWNRQLCQWWRSKGYDDVFDEFYECKGFINLYHGNCNTRIPEDVRA